MQCYDNAMQSTIEQKSSTFDLIFWFNFLKYSATADYL